MAEIHPVTKDRAPSDIHDIFDKLTHKFGRMPNIFGVMAQRPKVLKHFLDVYSAIVAEGTIAEKYKELAYLKTSMLNDCEY
jgi:alkylhydroperoxidase family enzyme